MLLIPGFDSAGNLPPGIHSATWRQIEQRFGFTPRRQMLLHGLYEALGMLKAVGCRLLLRWQLRYQQAGTRRFRRLVGDRLRRYREARPGLPGLLAFESPAETEIRRRVLSGRAARGC